MAKTIVAVGYVLEGAALFIRLEAEVRYKPENRDSGEPHLDVAASGRLDSLPVNVVWSCKRIRQPYYQIVSTCEDEAIGARVTIFVGQIEYDRAHG